MHLTQCSELVHSFRAQCMITEHLSHDRSRADGSGNKRQSASDCRGEGRKRISDCTLSEAVSSVNKSKAGSGKESVMGS